MSEEPRGDAALPRITVSILNFRRRPELQKVLDATLAQDYPHFDVIVVDNGSGEEDTAFIRRNYPQVQLIEVGENRGTVARNYGIREARGDIVVMLDNDVYLDGPAGLRQVARAFERHPGAGCVAFRVYHPATGRLHTRDWAHPRAWDRAEMEEFPTHYITEGASAFRAEVFRRIDPYPDEFFVGQEGADVAFRLLDAGYEIWYTPEVKVWHMASLETRMSGRPFYYNTRNMFLLVYRNLPVADAVIFAAPRLAVLAVYALKYGHFRLFAAGLRDGLRCLRTHAWRKPIARRRCAGSPS